MKRRRLLTGSMLGALAFAGGCAGSARTPQTIEGTWSISSATLAGQAVPLSALGDGLLHLDAGLYTFQQDRGDYVVLPGTQPAALDLHGQDGPNAGRTLLAIFSLSGDTLTIAYDLGGAARPTRFESLPGTRQFLVVYRRS